MTPKLFLVNVGGSWGGPSSYVDSYWLSLPAAVHRASMIHAELQKDPDGELVSVLEVTIGEPVCVATPRFDPDRSPEVRI